MKPVFTTPTKPAPEPVFYGGKGAGIAAALKQQQSDSAKVGVITSPPVATDSQIGPQSLFFQTIVVPAQRKYPVQVKGNFVYIEGIAYTGANGMWQYPEVNGLTFRTDTMQTQIQLWEAYREFSFPTPFSYIEFINNTNAPATITFWSGFGGVRRDRNLSPHFTWSGAANGAAVNVDKNHVLVDSPFKFFVPVSRYVQNSVLTSVKVVVNTTTPPDAALWLFSAYTNAPVFAAGAAFTYNQSVLPAEVQPLCTVPLTAPVTGDPATSATSIFYANGLSIPIFSTETDATNPMPEYVVAGYLVSGANYVPKAAEVWLVTLGVQFA